MRTEFSHYAIDPNADPDFQRQPLTDEVEVLIIGAGLGGLLCGARLRSASSHPYRPYSPDLIIRAVILPMLPPDFRRRRAVFQYSSTSTVSVTGTDWQAST